MLNLTDVTLADEDNNSIIIADDANRAIPANAMWQYARQVAIAHTNCPPQIWHKFHNISYQYKYVTY